MPITSSVSLISGEDYVTYKHVLHIIRKVFYRASAGVCCTKIHAEMAEKLHVKDQTFIFTDVTVHYY